MFSALKASLVRFFKGYAVNAMTVLGRLLLGHGKGVFMPLSFVIQEWPTSAICPIVIIYPQPISICMEPLRKALKRIRSKNKIKEAILIHEIQSLAHYESWFKKIEIFQKKIAWHISFNKFIILTQFDNVAFIRKSKNK